ncbi:Cytochrome P450 [Penicillium expansum]|uniref:Cytochrome P450 n=1 Tax=Penicillium expansum TaxID=27334 RepID=A0A0A2IZC7_PENEN|nr:Cytochrome P450 [Penicillium expansum]KGO43074.1 Cytochrome P450 [Penicillium expansum]KGO48452.1 Cytochrome P450 [Penicillium expansum]KGO53883.1 Cytochrome P450 [Penicillium expansum]
MWKEYAKADSRYMTMEPFVLCMESITAFAWGPLCYFVSWMIVTASPHRHPTQLIVSMGQFYGDILYYGTSMLEEYYHGVSYSRPETFYYWGYFIFLNSFWIVIPAFCMYQSYSAMVGVSQKSIIHTKKTIIDTPESPLFANSLLAIFDSTSFQVAVLGLLTLLVLTYSLSLFDFIWTRRSQRPGKPAPTLPYHLPGLYHGFDLGWSMASFLANTVRRWGYISPIGVRAGPFKFTMIVNPSHIKTILRSSRSLTNRPMMAFVMEKWFRTPKEYLHFYAAHDPSASIPGEKPEHMHDFQVKTSLKYLSGKHLLAMSERYLAVLKSRLVALEIPTDSWIEISDFYAWLQSQVTPSVIEAMMGSRLLEMYPDIVEDFWEFEHQVANYSRGLPRWIIPSAYETRDRLLANIKAWNRLANRESDYTQHGGEGPEWDEYFGSKFIKAREDYLRKYGMDEDSIASENLALLFGANANAVPAVFWYIFESFKDLELQENLKTELQDCLKPETGDLDIPKLSTKPLLQSTYAEVLRLRVTTSTIRTNEDANFRLGPDYTIGKNMIMTIFSSVTAYNRQAWEATRPETVTIPLDEFWPERFVRKDKIDANFSLEGLTECWMPYGGGHRMCPGRHFAKNEIIGTLGVLLELFECELVDVKQAERVKPDTRWVPYGTLPPTKKLAVRLRRRTE